MPPKEWTKSGTTSISTHSAVSRGQRAAAIDGEDREEVEQDRLIDLVFTQIEDDVVLVLLRPHRRVLRNSEYCVTPITTAATATTTRSA